MTPNAVLFDFDGVLADTENVHVVAWERTLAELGLDAPDEVCARAAEQDDRTFLAELFGSKGIEGGDVEGWCRRKQALTARLLADAPRLYLGAAELIGTLRGRARLAVVSTTWRENIAAVLEAAGLADAFELVVGKEDVSAVKPDPECYRRALETLRLDPGAAVALEDSPSGLAAARGAGLRAVAVGQRRPRGDWHGEVPFVAGLDDLPAILGAIGMG